MKCNFYTKIGAGFLACLMMIALIVPLSICANTTQTSPTYIFRETFSGTTINTDVQAVEESGGFWHCIEGGSEFTLAEDTLKYTDRVNSDYIDLRFYEDNPQKDLAQDFILSFRIKPLVDNLNSEFAWREYSITSWENSTFKITAGKLYLGGQEMQNASLVKDNWSLVEIMFDHEEASSQDNSGKTGATNSIKLMLDGVIIGETATQNSYGNINSFRLFQWSSGEFELDELAISLGSASLINAPTEPNVPDSQGPEEEPAEQEILYKKDFSKSTVNTNSAQSACEADEGFWACVNSGSKFSLENGTLKYTDINAKDYIDLRFNYPSTAKNLARDFILSFKIKPSSHSLSTQFAWRDHDHSSAENNVEISCGRFRIAGRTYVDAVLDKSEWYLVEIAYHYNKNATAVTGETGAIDSYTIMLNGKEVATVNAKIKFNNIDFFRMFQWSTYEYELDDIIIATGNKSLNNGQFEEWTPQEYYFNKRSVTDYEYSFCIVGDTQKVTRHAPDQLSYIYDWIVDNAQEKNIQYVFGLGDITDQDKIEEWEVASEQIAKLDGVVPYSVVRGNHDGSENINKYFLDNKAYVEQFEGFFSEDSMETSWRRLTVGNTKYLMITFDLGPTDEEIEWAAEIIEKYPDHRVIITTHAYLLADGSLIDSSNPHAPTVYDTNSNDGDEMWEKLFSKYENIFLVISGHISSDYVVTTQRKGTHGNTVTQMLVDPQTLDGEIGATGMVTMLYFSADGKEIAVETYSTIRERYFLKENQFEIDITPWASHASFAPHASEDITNDVETDAKTEHNIPNTVASDTVAENSDREQDKGGCKSNVGLGALSLSMMAIGFIIIKRKRRME